MSKTGIQQSTLCYKLISIKQTNVSAKKNKNEDRQSTPAKKIDKHTKFAIAQ